MFESHHAQIEKMFVKQTRQPTQSRYDAEIQEKLHVLEHHINDLEIIIKDVKPAINVRVGELSREIRELQRI